MRVLIVHHGALPTDGQVATGGALRAFYMAEALQSAVHTVRLLTREQDGEGGFSTSEDLYQKARAWGPDRIIAIQIEDAPALGAVGAPIAVDLYAPRVMEAAFDGSLRDTSVTTLARSPLAMYSWSQIRVSVTLVGTPGHGWRRCSKGSTLLIPIVAQGRGDERRSTHLRGGWCELAVAEPRPQSEAGPRPPRQARRG